MVHIPGNYYAAGQSDVVRVVVNEWVDGTIEVFSESEKTFIRQSDSGDHQFGMVLSNVPVELTFSDGALFQPDDPSFRWQAVKKSSAGLVSKLESHWGMVAFAAVAVPVFLWWVVFVALPNSAESAVELFPDVVFEQAEQQTLLVMEKTLLDESELPIETQQELTNTWNESLSRLSIAPERYNLLFRKSDVLGPNAFALPHGTVVITDELVTLLDEKEDALLAVMLHEIGHVEYQHGMKMVARSAATSLFFALLLGDIEGIGEYVIGASSSLLDSAFSRDMEREADEYAIEKLEALDKSPTAFADAMKGFLSLSEQDGEEHHSLLKYLNSHPSTKERIEAAEEAASH